ncbi:MAG: site-specific integrase [Saprospiraceae bacterium]
MFHETSFLKYLALERRFSPHTIKAYSHDLSLFLGFVQEQYCLTSVTEVRHLHIRSWIVGLMESGQSPRSINRRLSCLKSYFKFLKKRNQIEKDPMLKVIPPRTGKRLPEYIQEKNIGHLFQEVDFGEGYLGACKRLMLEVLYATGIRRSELTNQPEQIDPNRQFLYSERK